VRGHRMLVGLVWIVALPVFGEQCTPEPLDLSAWWPANGNSNDIIGGNGGTIQGSVGFAKGEVGQAFSFTGEGQVSIPSLTFETPDTGFSIEA